MSGGHVSGLISLIVTAPVASVAASAAQPGMRPLSDGALPPASVLHQWLRAALTCPTVEDIQGQPHGRTRVHMIYDADTSTAHYHTQPSHAANLQHHLTAKDASRWKTVKPTERLISCLTSSTATRPAATSPCRQRTTASCRTGVGRAGWASLWTAFTASDAFTTARSPSVANRLGAELLNLIDECQRCNLQLIRYNTEATLRHVGQIPAHLMQLVLSVERLREQQDYSHPPRLMDATDKVEDDEERNEQRLELEELRAWKRQFVTAETETRVTDTSDTSSLR